MLHLMCGYFKLFNSLLSLKALRNFETLTKKRNKRFLNIAKTVYFRFDSILISILTTFKARTSIKEVTLAKNIPYTIAKTFLNFYINEPKLAAYFSFINKGDFRRFRFFYLII